MNDFIITITNRDKLLTAESSIREVGSRYDNEAQRFVFVRPEGFEDADLLLHFALGQRTGVVHTMLAPVNLGAANEYILTRDITSYPRFDIQLAFERGGKEVTHSNKLQFILRPSVDGEELSELPAGSTLPRQVQELIDSAFVQAEYSGDTLTLTSSGGRKTGVTIRGGDTGVAAIAPYMPDRFTLAPNEPFELYLDPLVAEYDAPYALSAMAGGNKGNGYPHKWSVIPAAADESFALDLTVKQSGQAVFEKTVQLQVVNRQDGTPEVQKLMCVGDSITAAMTPFMAYLEQSSARDYGSGRFVFVGTQGTAPYKHEGRGGWSTGDYTKNSAGNPFWNAATAKLDFANYSAVNKITPDIVHLMLGANNVWSVYQGNVQPYLSDMQTLVNQMRKDWPNTQIYISPTPQWGNAAGFGYVSSVRTSAYRPRLATALARFAQGLYETFSGVPNVFLTYSYWAFDTENNYISGNTTVNPFSTEAVKIQTDIVHPSVSGHRQLASSFYSAWYAHHTLAGGGEEGGGHETVTVTNLLPDPLFTKPGTSFYTSGVPSEVSAGVLTLRPTGSITQSTFIMPATYPDYSHKYYVRAKSKTAQVAGSSRYIVLGGPNATGAWSNSASTDWVVLSDVMQSTAMTSFIPTVSYSSALVADGLIWQFTEPMLIDLTATFGAGSEPNKAWCDQNIPFFTGTAEVTV